jgi:CDP-diacylglycerol--glycerol-3-phosphate 3-phosphatidyltransferase
MSTYARPTTRPSRVPTPVRATVQTTVQTTVTVTTWPNLVTLVRTVLAVALGSAGVGTHHEQLLVVAYAVYWVGDMADGWLARRLDQETRVGAVFDIVGDRACTVLLCAGVVSLRPDAWLVGLVFLVSFAVVDTMLSLSFLYWDLLGPNDFHVVDHLVWALNWSPVAKAVNTTAVIGLVLLDATSAALVVALAVLALKTWSTVRVAALVS